jgi:hypothetical protein
MARGYSVVGYESLTIADSAVGLTAVTTGKVFAGKLETGSVRMRGDGTAPTASEGILVDIGQVVILSESEIGLSKFIRTGSTSGVPSVLGQSWWLM